MTAMELAGYIAALKDRMKKYGSDVLTEMNRPQENEMLNMLGGTAKFKDTGRESSGPGEGLDSLVGAPVRQGISELQDGNYDVEALKRIVGRIGKDPQGAPTAVDIASKQTDNPYLGAALATGIDLFGQVPIPGMQMAGVSGKVKNIAPKAHAAKELLEKIGSAEAAVKLKGAERAKYLKALDEVYGDRSKRAKDLGFGEDTWYHGTTVPVDEFKNEAKGLSTGAQSAKKGFFFAQDPSTASDYADLAMEKGVIREGDNVTTKWMSDNHVEPEKLSYSDVDRAKGVWEEAVGRTKKYLGEQKKELQKALDGWEGFRSDPNGPEKFKWGFEAAKAKDPNIKTFDDWINAMQEKIKSRYDLSLKPSTPEEIASAEKNFFETYKQYHQTGSAPHGTHSIYMETKNPVTRKILESAKKAGEDAAQSQGQNVLPVRLRPGEGKVHTKNYKGQGYRDTTYADEMAKAQEKGSSGVLFKNTYDPADPHNRVEQNIAAVFEPNQIRSTNAAFDPRFKDSPLLLAGRTAPNMPVNINLDEEDKDETLEAVRRLLRAK